MPPPAKKAHKIEPNEVDEVVPTKKTKDERERFWAQQERRRERFALPLDESMYPQGDFDVVDASRAAGLTVTSLLVVRAVQTVVPRVDCRRVLYAHLSMMAV